MTAEEKVQALASALNKINHVIFAVGAPLGSERYFEVRTLACQTLRDCDLPIEDVV